MNKELIEGLKHQIAKDAKVNGDIHITSFQEEIGILLTRNEAKQCLAALEGRERGLSEMIDHIEQAEVGIPIDMFFNDDGSHITKRQYGAILIKILCSDLREKYLTVQQ